MGSLQSLLQTFQQYVTTMTNALVNGITRVPNLAADSVALAFCQAVAAVALVLQQMIAHIYSTERLATSTGTDVDSFVNDWGLYRLQATYSSGYLTLYRGQTASALSLPVTPQSLAQTAINQIQFQLIPDTTGLSSWDEGTQTYNFAPDQASIQVSVQALVAGSGGNVAPGAISQIVAGFQGVNSCSNLTQFVNGNNTETDAALKVRFVDYINSLDTS